MSTKKAKPATTSPFREIPIAQISESTKQPRQEFQEAALKELAASVKALGIIQPVVVRELKADRYEIIAGARRFRAAKQAKLKTVPCVVRDLDKNQAFFIAVAENLQRADLTPVEEAVAYKALLDSDPKLSQEKLASRLGRSQGYISNKLRILELEPEMIAEVKKGKLTEAHAKALVTLPPEQRREVLEESRQGHWSSRTLEQAVAERKNRIARQGQVEASNAKARVTAVASMKKALAKGQRVIGEIRDGDDQYLHKKDMPKGTYTVKAGSRMPTEWDLKFPECKTCPTLKVIKRDGMDNTKALLISRQFREMAACGNPDHFKYLAAKHEKAAAEGKKKVTNEVERLRTAAANAMKNPQGVMNELGLRILMYTAYTGGNQYSNYLTPTAQRIVKLSGRSAEDIKSATLNDLWLAIEKLKVEQITDELAALLAQSIVIQPTERYGGLDRQSEVRGALFKAAAVVTKIYGNGQPSGPTAPEKAKPKAKAKSKTKAA